MNILGFQDKCRKRALHLDCRGAGDKLLHLRGAWALQWGQHEDGSQSQQMLRQHVLDNIPLFFLSFAKAKM